MKGQCLPLWLIGFLGGPGRLVSGSSLIARGVDNPSPEAFVRRLASTVAVIGDYVYIDGGELVQRINGSEPDGFGPCVPVNSTLSINLKESWSNETVELTSIPKSAPLLNQQIHWTDLSTRTIYTWGGKASVGQSPPANELWRFNADGQGGGKWTQVTQQDYLDFSKLVRPYGSAFAQSKDVGFATGGQVSERSDSAIQKEEPGYALTGIVSYDFRTGQWANTSTSDFEGYGTSLNAQAQFIPYGPNGLLLFLGGAETPVDATNDTIVQMSWNSLTLYDPVAKRWYKQPTTGMRPPTMEKACTVGVQGPDNTYEIFIYGGVSDQTQATSSDVHVLTIPGFNFFKSDSLSTPRSGHSCVVVGKGKRQMLTVGGVDGAFRNHSLPTSADPLKQGLGILDMTKLQWMDSYDPEIAEYESPDMVKDWYTKGGLDGVRWNSAEIKALFVNDTSNPFGDKPSESGTKSVSVIAGCTVGAVVGVVALGGLGYFVIRRRRTREKSKDSDRRPSSAEYEIAEYRPEPWPKDPPSLVSPMSFDETVVGSSEEIDGREVQGKPEWKPGMKRELTGPGGGWRKELPGPETDDRRELGGAEIYPVGELPGQEVQRVYELPAPVTNSRAELPDRKYSV